MVAPIVAPVTKHVLLLSGGIRTYKDDVLYSVTYMDRCRRKFCRSEIVSRSRRHNFLGNTVAPIMRCDRIS